LPHLLHAFGRGNLGLRSWSVFGGTGRRLCGPAQPRSSFRLLRRD
jgi:hypothetical protein